MSAMASQITGVSMVCSTVCSNANQRKHQSSAPLPFVRGINWCPVDPHKRPVTRKMFPFDDIIMKLVWGKPPFREVVHITWRPGINLKEVIRQYDSCNTGELDRHAQHQQPCLASRTLRVTVQQEQPVLSGTHWSSLAHRQMSVVLCLRRFPMKIENCHIRHQRPPKVHQRTPR